MSASCRLQRARQVQGICRQKKTTMHKSWEELSERERAAAAVFGFTERFIWTVRFTGFLLGCSCIGRKRERFQRNVTVVTIIMPFKFHSRAWYRDWADLKEHERAAAAALGYYSKSTWNWEEMWTRNGRIARAYAGDAVVDSDYDSFDSDFCPESDSDIDTLSCSSACDLVSAPSGEWDGERITPMPFDAGYHLERSRDSAWTYCISQISTPSASSRPLGPSFHICNIARMNLISYGGVAGHQRTKPLTRVFEHRRNHNTIIGFVVVSVGCERKQASFVK